jgi:hypothetical protein
MIEARDMGLVSPSKALRPFASICWHRSGSFITVAKVGRVWKNSELIGTLGTSHHSILDDPAAIRTTLSFFRAIKHNELAQQ